MKVKLIHFTDLDHKDKYILCMDNGIEIRQQEIQRHEYEDLKAADDSHFRQSLIDIQDKYKLLQTA